MQLRIIYLITLALLVNGCGQVQKQDSQKSSQKTAKSAQEIEIIETADDLIKKKLEWAAFTDSRTEKYIQFHLVDGEIFANFPVFFYASNSYRHESTITEYSKCSGEEPSLNMDDFTKNNYMSSLEVNNLKKIILSKNIDHFVSYCRRYGINGELIGHSVDIDFKFSHPAHEWPAQIQSLFNEVRGISPEKISIESEIQSL